MAAAAAAAAGTAVALAVAVVEEALEEIIQAHLVGTEDMAVAVAGQVLAQQQLEPADQGVLTAKCQRYLAPSLDSTGRATHLQAPAAKGLLPLRGLNNAC